MNRFFRIVAALLLGTCLASVVLALTALRPRSKVVSTTFETQAKGSFVDAPIRTRVQITHHWVLAPPWEWHIGLNGIAACGGWGQTLTDGWQYGPFTFIEERDSSSWPLAVEEAARTEAIQKLGVKEPALDIRLNNSEVLSWHVLASDPDGKRIEMDFDEHGSPFLGKK